jgi:hypothetical protein
MVGARVLKGIVLDSAGTTKVSHGLSRIPAGWIVIDQTVVANITRDPAMTQELSTYLYLETSADVTVNLLVF